jgi:glycosyltransferase involved in cell wall biosynthesis
MNDSGTVHNAHIAPVLHVVYREGFGPVFSSQVLSLADKALASGFNVRIVVFMTVGEIIKGRTRSAWREKISGTSNGLRNRIRRLPTYHKWNYPVWDAILLFAYIAVKYCGRPVILHCRNELATTVANRVKKWAPFLRIKVILDYRGVGYEEIVYKSDHNADILRLAEEAFEVESSAARNSDAVICVSEKLAEFVIKQYGIDRSKLSVIPCTVDTVKFKDGLKYREQGRMDLRLTHKVVFGYCGSLEKWQCPEKCIKLFAEIWRLYGDRVHLLAVTTAPERMQRVVEQHNIAPQCVTITSVNHDEVPAKLAILDVGFLIRERTVVNEVSSPVKFGEYLGSGTSVIISEQVGDYSELVDREKIGIVVSDFDLEEMPKPLRRFCESLRDEDERRIYRERCLNVAEKCLSHAAYLPVLCSLYERLSNAES